MSISNLGQISITVKDVHRATEFYRDVLGLKFLFAPPNMAFFDCGGVRLYLGEHEAGGHAQGTSIFYFRVNDLEQRHAAMAAAGAKIEQKPHLVAKMPDHELWMMFFRDSEDNIMALMEERR